MARSCRRFVTILWASPGGLYPVTLCVEEGPGEVINDDGLVVDPKTGEVIRELVEGVDIPVSLEL